MPFKIAKANTIDIKKLLLYNLESEVVKNGSIKKH